MNAFEKWGAGATGYTASYWVQVDGAHSTYSQAFGDGGFGGAFYMMQYLQLADPSTGESCPRPHYGINNGSWDPSPCTLGALLTPGTPHHVVVTWDQPSGVVHVWIDDVEFVQLGKPTGIPSSTASPMWLGHDDREPGWDIVLDEPAFWNRALSAAEVAGLSAAARDGDGDGVPDVDDICPVSDDHADFDGDGVPDGCDNCATLANADQSDWNSDGTGDACDDVDGDGVLDSADNCPLVSNPDQGDSDADTAGDACDADDDNDGVDDVDDNCQLAPNTDQADLDGDGAGDECDGDSDGDGVTDDDEIPACHGTPLDVPVSADGCSGAQIVDATCGVCADHGNTGAYVSCASDVTNDAKKDGLLSGKEKASIVRVAARSCK